MSLTEYGILSAIATAAGGALAATTTPWLVGKIGLRKTSIIGVVVVPMQAAMYMFFNEVENLPAWPLLVSTYVMMAWGVSLYGYSASISRFRWASKAQAGTDYALQSSIWNLGVSSGASISGFVAATAGWTLFFPIAAVATLAGAFFYVGLFNRIETLVQERERHEIEVHQEDADGVSDMVPAPTD